MHDIQCQRQAGGTGFQGHQLQGQAFAQVAGADATGLQGLDDAQSSLQLSRLRAGCDLLNLFQRLAQEAIFVQGIDDEIGERVVAFTQSQQQKLLVQGVMQGGRRGRPLGPVRGVISAAADAAPGEIQVTAGGVFGGAVG